MLNSKKKLVKRSALGLAFVFFGLVLIAQTNEPFNTQLLDGRWIGIGGTSGVTPDFRWLYDEATDDRSEWIDADDNVFEHWTDSGSTVTGVWAGDYTVSGTFTASGGLSGIDVEDLSTQGGTGTAVVSDGDTTLSMQDVVLDSELPLADADVADTLTIGASSTVADGALSSNVPLKDGTETISGTWTFSGEIQTATATTSIASLNVPHGTAPSAPDNGDFWSTTAGFFGRVDGATVGPFIDSSGAGAGTLEALTDTTISAAAANQPLVRNSGNTAWINSDDLLLPGYLAINDVKSVQNRGIDQSVNVAANVKWFLENAGGPAAVDLDNGESSSSFVRFGVGANDDTITTGPEADRAGFLVSNIDLDRGLRLHAYTGGIHFFTDNSPVLKASLTDDDLELFVPLIAPAATTSIASLNLPHGTAPSSPTNGDFWTTTTSAYARINGATVDLVAAGSTSAGTDDTTQGVWTAYGDNGTNGGRSVWNNGASEDTTNEFLALEANGDQFDFEDGAGNVLASIMDGAGQGGYFRTQRTSGGFSYAETRAGQLQTTGTGFDTLILLTPIEDNEVAAVFVTATGIKSDGTQMAAYTRRYTFSNLSGTEAVENSTSFSTDFEDDSNWDIQAVAAAGFYLIQVRGNTGDTVNWAGTADIARATIP